MVKSNSDMKSIRKKLLAAVAMLLVASIMVVSSSYAWFTLSTAPEVTGITTSVGSNGNLEMALRQNINDLTAITNTDSATQFPEANKFWGNLVDLSDASYHLSEIALLPARLNAVLDENSSKQLKDAAGQLIWQRVDGTQYAAAEAEEGSIPVYGEKVYKLANGGYLKTPTYGADGRLSSLDANTVNGIYDNVTNKAFVASNNELGVRAVGVTSLISPAALVLRNAKLTVNNAISEGKSNATTSLRVDAVKLAQIYVAATIKGEGATFTATEVGHIETTIGRLNGILVDLENALKEAVVAVGVSEGKSFTADKVTITADNISVTDVELDWNSFTDAADAKADLQRAYAKLASTKSVLDGAARDLATLKATNTTGSYSVAEITAVLATLLDQRDFKVNGEDVAALKQKTPGELLALVSGGTLNVEIQGGVYYTIAELVGNYSGSTSMEVEDVVYGGMELGDMKFENVVMSTNVQPNAGTMPKGFHLPYVQNWLGTLVPSGDTGAADLITDIYGYIIDLAFRTNATGSTLQLQTEAANRVNDSAATQGEGSYMEFTVAHADYTVKQMIDLLQNVRVVFVDSTDAIYGVAKLDVGYNPTAIDMPTNPEEGKYYIPAIETGKVHEMTAGTLNENTVKAALHLYNFTVEDDGKMKLSTKKSSADITALQQNVAAGVSALVFLDGDGVENGDVAISGNSMTGTMNLQFSSSASLTPMNYTFQEKLEKPVISIADNTLTITAVTGATSYDVYVAGLGTPINVTGTTYDLSTIQGPVAGQTYSISVVAKADGKLDSDKSDAKSWTAPV